MRSTPFSTSAVPGVDDLTPNDMMIKFTERSIEACANAELACPTVPTLLSEKGLGSRV